MRNCNHIKSDGRPCNAPALRKHSYCFFHQQQLNRRRREYPDRLPILEDRAAVQVAIMQVLDRLYLKTIDYKAAALMLYGLQLASTNLKQDVFGRLNSEKVDRYYGNANETDVCTTDTSPAAVAGSRHSQLTTSLRPPSRCPRSHAEGVDLGSDAPNPDFGLYGNLVVPEARNEGSPARTAGSQAPSLNTVPEGRLTPPANTPAARLGGGAYKLDPERAAELERLFSETIPEINACTDDSAENGCKYGCKEKLDAPPLSRSDGVGTTSSIICHSERSEESLSPNTLFDSPHLPIRQNSVPSFATRDPRLATTHNSQLTTHLPEGRNMLAQHGSAGYKTGAKPLPRCRRRMLPCLRLTTHNSRLTTASTQLTTNSSL
jgi:hypothetical protein